MTPVTEDGTVFVHGWGCGVEDWSDVLTLLPAELPVCTVTLPGHLGSTKEKPLNSIEASAAYVLEKARSAGFSRFSLIGHSMGARIAIALAAQRTHCVTRLLLVDCSYVPGEPDSATQKLEHALATMGQADWAEDTIASMHVENLAAERRRALVARTAQTPAATLTTYYRAMTAWDAECLESALSRLHCPVTVLQATSLDASEKRWSVDVKENSLWIAAIKKALPNADIQKLSKTGHFAMIEHPDVVAEWSARMA